MAVSKREAKIARFEADTSHHWVACIFIYLVDEQDSIKVIDLVLKNDRDKSLSP